MTRTLKAVGSVLALAGLIIALPILLATLGGNPLPSTWPSMDQVITALTRPDDGSLFIGALTIAGWLGWASFTLSVLIEIPAQIRHRPPMRIKGLGPQQHLAAVLVAGTLALLAAPALPAPAAAAPVPETAAPTTTETADPASPIEQDHTRTSTEAEPTHTPARPVYEVQPGDSLWSIAEDKLGDGMRWTQVRDLNLGRTQPDGYHLRAGSEWIEPGWRLILPADAAHAQDETTEVAHERYTVQQGDSLWSIAEGKLGDGARWTEIYRASRDIDQGGGTYLADPDVIDIGWELIIPTAQTEARAQEASSPRTTTGPDATASAESADHRDTDTTAAGAQAEAPGSTDHNQAQDAATAGAGATERTDSHPTAASQQNQQAPTYQEQDLAEQGHGADEAEAPISVRTIGGVGSILAAGVLGVLTVRRRRTQRTRPPGARIALPEPGSSDSQIENELLAIADPIGLDTVNTALRDLGSWATSEELSLPDVRAARLTSDGTEFQLYLNAPSQLPAPWSGSADQRVWVLAADDVDEDLLTRTDPEDAPAPWPSLVTLGHDDEDAHLMLDLEQVGHLDISGDTEAAHSTLAALAVELATSRWADDLQITLIGTMEDLPDAVDTSRLRYVNGLDAVLQELRARAEDMSQEGATTTEAWTPEILIVGTDLDATARAQLDDLTSQIPRVGIAAVTTDTGSGEWALDIDPEHAGEAVLDPTGLRVRPQQISTGDYAAMLSVLTGADRITPGPTWASQLATRTEPALEDLPEPVAEDDDPAAAPQVAEVQVTPINLQANEPGPAPVSTLHEASVLLLGEVDLTGITPGQIAETHIPQALELIAYLSLHPQADTDAISAALWPDIEVKSSTRKSAVSRARKLLGVDDDGRPYLPHTSTASTGNPYALQGITSDWDRFNQLRGTDVTTAPLADLLQALSLVRAEPFSRIRTGRARVRPGRYVWAEPHIHEMTASIADVACEAAHRALADGRPKAATQATTAGLRATHDDERVWRYAIRAAQTTGDQARVRELITGLNAHLASLDVDPQPETNDLLDQLTAHRAAG